VLSVDEKSQIQALDRTQPILPLRPGLPEQQTHDYERHGTTTPFAALNVLEGTVIGQAGRAESDPAPDLTLFVPRKGKLPAAEDSDTGPQHRSSSPETSDRATVRQFD
jgi:hypothetical protein